MIHQLEQLGHPDRAALGHDALELWVALEDAGPDHERERARQPPRHLGDVDTKRAGHIRQRITRRLRTEQRGAEILLHRGRTRMEVDDHPELLARRPHRLVLRVVVRVLVHPQVGDQDPAEAVLARPADLLHRLLDVPERRHLGQAEAPLGLGLVAADALELLLFQDAQQLRLEGGGDLT